jgi:hypothetical protein
MIEGNIAEGSKVVLGLGPSTPSTSTPAYVSLKDYAHITAIITVLNATTVTGSAITCKQATAVAGTSEKALSFDTVWANADTAASDALVKTAVVSNTFTTTAVNSKKAVYVIEIDAAKLDVNNSFDCFRVGTGDATASTLSVVYILSRPRYSQATPPTAVTD